MKAEAWQVVTGGNAESILSLDDVKAHLRVSGSEEDSLIASYIQAAADRCGAYLGRSLATQTVDVFFCGFPSGRCALELPLPPLQSVVWVKYTLADGSVVTLDPGVYQVVTATEPGVLVLAAGGQWPAVALGPALPVTVRMVAGYMSMPDALKQAMRWEVGQMFELREGVVDGGARAPQVVPRAVQFSLDTVGRFLYRF